MRAFAELYAALDETTRTNDKVAAMARYFAAAPPADAAWALYFLSGRKPRQVIGTRRLSEWAIEAAGIPPWLFSECYDAVGDFAETVALLLPDVDDGRRTTDHSLTEGEGWAVDEDPATTSHSLTRDAPPSSVVGRPSSLAGQSLPPDSGLAYWIEERLLPLRAAGEEVQKSELLRAWAELGGGERFLWNKLITGAFRVGVSQRLVTRALAQVSGVEDAAIAHRLMGDWEPSADWYSRLLATETADADVSQPYPFCLAHPLENDPGSLGDRAEWQVEWKWDGIRAQLIRRAGRSFLWSRGEELISERFPELIDAGDELPDGTVIDGEVLPFLDGAVLPFAQLQRRIGRKQLSKKILAEVPVVLYCYDLLERDGGDLRGLPLSERREQLEEVLVAAAPTTEDEGRRASPGAGRAFEAEALVLPPSSFLLRLSPIVAGESWEALAAARERSRELSAEGLMIKRRSSPYRVGRVRGDWWKWKVEPYTVDAVLIYAQRGSGKRASLYSDYTFGVWDGDQLVPFAKAYSGLTDAEIRQVDAFVRRNTVEQFGPVRTVRPELVFELAFEGIQRSTRHKSGVAVRFPRMLRWRRDKPAAEADSIATVQALLEAK
jgi:DNA ligase-1